MHLFLITCSLERPSKLKMRTGLWNFKCLPVQWNDVFLFHVLCCFLVSLFWNIFWLGSECQLTFHLVQQKAQYYYNPLSNTVLEFWKRTSLPSDPASGSERIFLDCFKQVLNLQVSGQAAKFAANIYNVKLKQQFYIHANTVFPGDILHFI